MGFIFKRFICVYSFETIFFGRVSISQTGFDWFDGFRFQKFDFRLPLGNDLSLGLIRGLIKPFRGLMGFIFKDPTKIVTKIGTVSRPFFSFLFYQKQIYFVFEKQIFIFNQKILFFVKNKMWAVFFFVFFFCHKKTSYFASGLRYGFSRFLQRKKYVGQANNEKRCILIWRHRAFFLGVKFQLFFIFKIKKTDPKGRFPFG